MLPRLALRAIGLVLIFEMILASGVAPLRAQKAEPLDSRVALLVEGEVARKRSWTLSDLASLPQVEAKATEKDGKLVKFQGVPLTQVLQASEVPQGESLRGTALTFVVLVKAADGYQAAFALAELDPAMTDKKVVLALQADGQPLPDGVGPLRLIVPDEKRHARWVRNVTALEVVRVSSPAAQPTPNAAAKDMTR